MKNTGDQVDLTVVDSTLKAKAENLDDPDTGAQLPNDVMVYANAPYGTSRLRRPGDELQRRHHYDANGVDGVSFPPDDNDDEVFRYKHNSDEVTNGDITVKESFVRAE